MDPRARTAWYGALAHLVRHCWSVQDFAIIPGDARQVGGAAFRSGQGHAGDGGPAVLLLGLLSRSMERSARAVAGTVQRLSACREPGAHAREPQTLASDFHIRHFAIGTGICFHPVGTNSRGTETSGFGTGERVRLARAALGEDSLRICRSLPSSCDWP